MQNLNEVSARYTELPNEFYVPSAWRKQDTKNKQGSVSIGKWDPVIPPADKTIPISEDEYTTATQLLTNTCTACYAAYKQLLDAGVARELARMVLPVNFYTEIYTTWDLKNLLHFINLREDSHAQFEIQEVARGMKEIVTELFPWTLEAYERYKM